MSRFHLVRMRPRDPAEPHRVATSLELFFDLVFVVAVSIASAELHHFITDGEAAEGLLSYALVFFAIWWAWMNFTWFGTSFGTDDWLYRVVTVVQMAGALLMAVGIRAVFEHHDFRIVIVGYVVMRLAMVAQWLRAARAPGPTRRPALVYAVGVSTVQLLWLTVAVLPVAAQPFVVPLLIAAELLVPIVAVRLGVMPWQPHHITERYGLFTLIVLGESLLASANAVNEALTEVEALAPLLGIAGFALLVTAALWWIYFWPPHASAIHSDPTAFFYGYAHYAVFASAAAFSAGVEVEIDLLTGTTDVSPTAASFAVAVPIVLFVVGIWLIAIRRAADRIVNLAVPGAMLLVLVAPLLPGSLGIIAVVLVALIAVLVVRPPIAVPARVKTGGVAGA